MGNYSGSKPMIGRRITLNPEAIEAFCLEQFFTYCMKNFKHVTNVSGNTPLCFLSIRTGEKIFEDLFFAPHPKF